MAIKPWSYERRMSPGSHSSDHILRGTCRIISFIYVTYMILYVYIWWMYLSCIHVFTYIHIYIYIWIFVHLFVLVFVSSSWVYECLFWFCIPKCFAGTAHSSQVPMRRLRRRRHGPPHVQEVWEFLGLHNILQCPDHTLLGGGFKLLFIFTRNWENGPIWLIFFQMGWNHQLDYILVNLVTFPGMPHASNCHQWTIDARLNCSFGSVA